MTLELEARHLLSKGLHWRKPVPPGVFGIRRAPQAGRTSSPPPDSLEAAGKPASVADWWDVADDTLSGLHAVCERQGERLLVRRVTRPRLTTNPLKPRGQATADEFSVGPGEFFVTGNSVFRLVGAVPTERTVAPAELNRMLEDSDARLERLAGLPETVRFCTQPETLEQNVLDTLLKGIPSAVMAALVALDPCTEGEEAPVRVLRRVGPAREMVPSRTLVHHAVRRDGLPVSHVWPANHPFAVPGGAADAGDGDGPTLFGADADWAICCPLADTEPTRGWALYVAGRFPFGPPAAGPASPELNEAIRFTVLTGQFFASLRQVLYLKKREVQLGNYLGPSVVRAVAGRDIDEALRPGIIHAAVLLCDLRGFSRAMEQGQDDLLQLLRRVSAALDVMTSAIVHERGVIGDFQGDSALGFWGWPPGDHPDPVQRAALAALEISRKFERAARSEDNDLGRFACGVGVAAGRVVAGRIGSLDQFKVGVFGPTVNLAARLEGMTKQFGVPVLVDGAFANELRRTAPDSARLRRVGPVRPAGMEQVHEVYELLPSDAAEDVLERCRRYERGLAEFLAGLWARAERTLAPLGEDGPARFVVRRIAGRAEPPEDWPGFIALESK